MYSVNSPGRPSEPEAYALISVTVTPTEDGRNFHAFNVKREMPADEFGEVLWALRMLSRIGPQSEIRNLSGYLEDLREVAADQMSHLLTDQEEVRRLFPRTARRFADFLHAFVSFGDRTTAFLSQEYGSSTTVFQDFETAKSREYDSNAAYRLFCSLRNVSAHGAQVINNSRVNMKARADGGIDRELELSILAGPLVGVWRSRMNAAVRDEISTIEEPIHVIPAVNHAYESCARLHAELTAAIGEDYLAAVDLLEALCDEAGDVSHVFAGVPPDPLEGGLPGMMRVSEYAWEQVRETVTLAHELAKVPGGSVTFDELCVSPALTLSRLPDGSIVGQ